MHCCRLHKPKLYSYCVVVCSSIVVDIAPHEPTTIFKCSLQFNVSINMIYCILTCDTLIHMADYTFVLLKLSASPMCGEQLEDLVAINSSHFYIALYHNPALSRFTQWLPATCGIYSSLYTAHYGCNTTLVSLTKQRAFVRCPFKSRLSVQLYELFPFFYKLPFPQLQQVFLLLQLLTYTVCITVSHIHTHTGIKGAGKQKQTPLEHSLFILAGGHREMVWPQHFKLNYRVPWGERSLMCIDSNRTKGPKQSLYVLSGWIPLSKYLDNMYPCDTKV